MGMSKWLTGVLFLMFAGAVHAQEDRYMVFFTDKAESAFSVDNPSAFLSERSIQRRTRQNIAVIEEDLPVNASYVEMVAQTGAETYHTTRWLNGVLVQANEEELTAISALPFVKEVELAAPGTKLTPFVDDRPDLGPFFSPSDAPVNTDAQNRMLGVDEMHKDENTGSGMMVAVMDGGFRGVDESMVFQHFKDKNLLVHTMDFVSNRSDVFKSSGHGTEVLSCIAGSLGTAYVGTAFDAEVLLFMTEDVAEEYRIEEYNWLFAAEMADSIGADVLNSSVGYRDFDDAAMDYDFDQLDGVTSVISRANDIAATKGMISVTSSGNTSSNLTVPADAFAVLSVGAVDRVGERAFFSAFFDSSDGRTKPEVVALGVSVTTIDSGGEISTSTGTSFASPLIAGLALGVWQNFPEETSGQIIDRIIQSGSQFDDVTDPLGYGIPNYLRIIGRQITSTDAPVAEEDFAIYPNPSLTGFFQIDVPAANTSQIQVTVTDMTGKTLVVGAYEPQQTITLDISELAPSGYLVRITAGDQLVTKRVVRQ